MTTVVDHPSPPSVVTLQEIPLAKLHPHPRNPRRSVGDVAALAASILEHGVLEPLIVAPAPRGSSFVLIAGHRRAAAAKVAKLKTVPCLVRADLATDRAQLEAMLVENLQRADLTPVEESAAYEQLLLDPDLTPAALAARVGQPVKRIRDRVRLGKLDDALKDRLHAGQLTIEQGLVLVEFADDPKLSKALAKAAGSPSWSYTLARVREQRKAARALGRRTAKLTKSGVSVVTSWPKGALPICNEWIPGRTSLYLIPRAASHAEEDAWVLERHATCEGAVAVVWTLHGARVLTHACRLPDLHRPAEPVSATSSSTDGDLADHASQTDDARAQEQEQTREQQERDIAAATAVRRDFLRAEIAGAGDADARAILMDMICGSRSPQTFLLLSDLLQIEPLASSASSEEWRNHLGPKALVDMATPALVILLDIANNARGEIAMASPSTDPGLAWRSDEWVQRLDEMYEYPWSEHEIELFRPERFRPDYVDPQECVSCGEVVELGVVDGHPDQCSLCPEADDESLAQDDIDDDESPVRRHGDA